MGVTPSVLRCLFEQAGAHIWTRGDEVIHSDGRFLAVHTGQAGEVTVRLPSGVQAVPIGAFKARPKGESELTVTATRGETFWFSLRPVPDTHP